MDGTQIRVRYRPAKIELGGNMDAGAFVEILGLGCGPIAGVVPDPSLNPTLGDFEMVDPSFFPVLQHAAEHASNGRSGIILVNLEDFLPW